ncbi:hypothetical protein E5161_02180 [Cohnella pontilimi]|uniref:non-specific serine/threonine protein kinase n=1 Tax=Cohnella pontilimi TaxID=2564100 RepID=A0A4U0FH04_9BACL|nr:serine/threonine-protein kinase [Cohnella pontilimi]TJY44221.1 hypothetical protein E5161_02180 [Cohnella pontilimi]
MEDHRKPVPQLPAGTLYADRYRIVAPLGRGGMGQVYLAEDVRLGGKRRALKLTAASQEERASFVLEARMLSELQHPHLPDIVDYYPPDASGTAGIVMEYIAGDTLADLFERSGRHLPFARIFRYLNQLCDVLCYLHGREPQIVFRDLKPANVLIDRHDRAVLIDFGIARRYRPGAGSDTERLGTPAFAAPEQIRGEQTDGRTDLFGWGAIAFYLLSGGQFAIRRAGNLHRTLQPDVPREFTDVLERVLADDPAVRPENANQLRQLLQPIAGSAETAETSRRHSDVRTDDGVIVAAVVSAYPGAGATFCAIGLSKALSEAGVAHALVECPGREPELYELLDGDRRKPKHTAFADPSGQSDPVPAWRLGTASLYTLDPRRASPMPPEDVFAAWLRKLGVPLVILDVSSGWDSPGVAGWLAEHAGWIWWVADCMPAKWSVRRQEAGAELHRLIRKNGHASRWIANRDLRFPEREHWLSCFPERPVLTIPQYPTESVVQAVWRGEGVPGSSKSASHMNLAFQKWAGEVIESQRRKLSPFSPVV